MKPSGATLAAVAGIVLATAQTPAPAQSPGAYPTASPASQPVQTIPIKYVIVVVQENRTVDNLFQGQPGVETQSWGKNSAGQVVTLLPESIATDGDPSHRHDAFETDCNVMVPASGGPPVCQMNGFDREQVDDCVSGKTCVSPYSYVPESETDVERGYISTYAFADHVFQTNEGPSFPAHQYLIAGQSGGLNSNRLGWAENTGGTASGKATGCEPNPTGDAAEIDYAQPYGSPETKPVPSCGDFETIFDLLDNAKVSWKYYLWKVDQLWDGPAAQSHLWNSPVDNPKIITGPGTVLTDIENGNLAQVSYVTPDLANSDHPHGSNFNAKLGEQWVGSIVNAVQKSAYWPNTAILVTWDDWGGFYDHVPPPIGDANDWGMRVPLIAISPYAKPGYVDKTPRSQASILHFIETVYGLPSLNAQDAKTDDLTALFDFTQAAHTEKDIVDVQGFNPYIVTP